MNRFDLKKYQLPDSPGVYFFLGARKKILYIGKATSLKNRVRSYFSKDLIQTRSAVIKKMVDEAKTIEVTETDSVLEALILETNLIRTHKPVYNTRSKDDKSYNHLIITKEAYPRVLVVRGKDLASRFSKKDVQYHFGPFPSGQLFREALKIVRRIFQFYDTAQPLSAIKSKLAKGKVDFNRQIGLYPDNLSKAEYQKTIRHIRLFFEGKKQVLLKELEKDMMQYARQENFEAAAVIKKRIFALKHIQDVALIKDDVRVYRDDKTLRIEAYDIAHAGGKAMVGVMTVIESGQVENAEYRKFQIKGFTKANDPGALQEMLRRRLQHNEWTTPQIIVVDGNAIQKRAAERVLRELSLRIPVVAVVKNNRHKPERIIGQADLLHTHKHSILLANTEAHRFAINYHRTKRRKLQLDKDVSQ